MAVPKLRFKEFNQEWKNIVLEEVAQVERGKFSARPRNDPKYFNGNIPFVQTGDISNSDIFIEKYSQTLNELGLTVSKLFPPNTILITIAANIGDSAITKFSIACPDSIVGILVRENLSNVYFLKNILDLKKKTLDSQATQNAQKNINLQVLKPLEISIPTLDEQTKIANFLTAVDEKISQLNEQHQLMIQYKKGVMQKIFNQEIRFKDDNGEEFGEWEERILEDVSIIIMGSSPKSKNYNELGIGLPLLQGNADIKNRKSCPRNFTTEITKECDIGDILMSVRAPVGYVSKAMHDACIGRGIAAIRVKENNNQEFLYQYLIYMEDIWGKFSQGSTFDSVNSEQIRNLSIFIPCLQEQTKIADFLTKLDDKIERVALQLEQVKMWKKGLLQQMFV